MPRITCSDLGLGACKHVLEHESDEELLAQARAHAREEHGEEIDDDRLRAAIRADD